MTGCDSFLFVFQISLKCETDTAGDESCTLTKIECAGIARSSSAQGRVGTVQLLEGSRTHSVPFFKECPKQFSIKIADYCR